MENRSQSPSRSRLADCFIELLVAARCTPASGHARGQEQPVIAPWKKVVAVSPGFPGGHLILERNCDSSGPGLHPSRFGCRSPPIATLVSRACNKMHRFATQLTRDRSSSCAGRSYQPTAYRPFATVSERVDRKEASLQVDFQSRLLRRGVAVRDALY